MARKQAKNAATGYVHCGHKHCFAIIIGVPGDLCQDCADDPDASEVCCAGCDNDNVVDENGKTENA